MSESEFIGKNVLVTGSSRGIGLGIAGAFGLLGASVGLNCRKSEKELQEAVCELKGRGIRAEGFVGDISSYPECQRVFEEFEKSFGAVNILVNNAAVSEYGLFTDMTPAEWARLTEVNQFSVYNCCHLALPHMIRERAGIIINISSIWGVSGASCEVIYSASKGAVNSFTKALAKEVAPCGIIVNAIACGVIDTQMNARFSAEELEDLRLQTPLERLGTSLDVAELCVYLARTKYMTGQVIILDGGKI